MKFVTTNYELLLLFIVDIIFIDISTTNVAAFRIVTWNNNIRSNIMQQIPTQCSLSSSSYWSSCQKKQHINRIYLSSYEEHVNIEDDDDEIDDDEDDEISDEDLMASAGEWDEKVAKYNVVHLTGRVGFINEMKSLDDGKVVISLSIASTRKNHWLEKKLSSSSDNNAYDETDWYTLEVWGQKAEFINKFVDKGSRVSVIGQLQIDSWKDKETLEPRMKPKIIVREFEILETKAESELRRNNRGSSSSNSYSNNSNTNNNNNSNNNNYNNNKKNNNSGSNAADREQQRGRSFFTTDDDDDDDDSIESRNSNYGSRPAGTGGFFDR